MKVVFAELGVPNVIVSDGGPQYTSAEFKDFMRQLQIKHRVSSARNPQLNGMAERCVQTMKASLIKTMEEGEERHGLSTLDVQDYTPESQTVIASRITEL